MADNKVLVTISSTEWNEKLLKLADYYMVIQQCQDCGSPKKRGDVCLFCQKQEQLSKADELTILRDIMR